jgi:hypothetical protein
MKKQAKLWSALLMIVLASSLAMAVEKTTAPQPPAPTVQLEIGAQDVITASDAGGGYMSSRDIILVVIIIFAVIGLIAVL